ncbi:hypothetical protein LTR08_009309 [Meristemomyces frigidus]|nr:hypothetical protein LTR08_009309 [Meristemomyces frigidus]
MTSPDGKSTLQKSTTWLKDLATKLVRGQPSQNIELENGRAIPLERRATFSPKTAVSSLRMHLPRHKQKRGSLHNIGYGQAATLSGAEGPERYSTDSNRPETPRRHSSITGSFASSVRGFGRNQTKRIPRSELQLLERAVPVDVPLPTSPVDIPTKAPTLTLDLGPSAFTLPTLCTRLMDADKSTTALPVGTGLYAPPELVTHSNTHSSTPKGLLQPFSELSLLSQPFTPMPGTNLGIDLEDCQDRHVEPAPLNITLSDVCTSPSLILRLQKDASPEQHHLVALHKPCAPGLLTERKRDCSSAFGAPAPCEEDVGSQAGRAVSQTTTASTETSKRPRLDMCHPVDSLVGTPSPTNVTPQSDIYLGATLKESDLDGYAAAFLAEMEPLTRQPAREYNDFLDEGVPPPTPDWIVRLPFSWSGQSGSARVDNKHMDSRGGPHLMSLGLEYDQITACRNESFIETAHAELAHEKRLAVDVGISASGDGDARRRADSVFSRIEHISGEDGPASGTQALISHVFSFRPPVPPSVTAGCGQAKPDSTKTDSESIGSGSADLEDYGGDFNALLRTSGRSSNEVERTAALWASLGADLGLSRRERVGGAIREGLETQHTLRTSEWLRQALANETELTAALWTSLGADLGLSNSEHIGAAKKDGPETQHTSASKDDCNISSPDNNTDANAESWPSFDDLLVSLDEDSTTADCRLTAVESANLDEAFWSFTPSDRLRETPCGCLYDHQPDGASELRDPVEDSRTEQGLFVTETRPSTSRRSPSMGNRLDFDLKRSERNSRYNALQQRASERHASADCRFEIPESAADEHLQFAKFAEAFPPMPQDLSNDEEKKSSVSGIAKRSTKISSLRQPRADDRNHLHEEIIAAAGPSDIELSDKENEPPGSDSVSTKIDKLKSSIDSFRRPRVYGRQRSLKKMRSILDITAAVPGDTRSTGSESKEAARTDRNRNRFSVLDSW